MSPVSSFNVDRHNNSMILLGFLKYLLIVDVGILNPSSLKVYEESVSIRDLYALKTLEQTYVDYEGQMLGIEVKYAGMQY